MIKAQDIKGVTSCTLYTNGNMRECIVNEENLIQSPVGVLIPRYTRPDFRSKQLKSLAFYEDGNIRSICLNEQTNIMTPLGTFPAELVTFYENGSLHSVFPLNGQINFGWSEQEEGELAKTYDFHLSFGTITVKLNGMRFYPHGQLKSLLFWPGETVLLQTPAGTFSARIGVHLFENGHLESFEPAVLTEINTPIGPVIAYDVNALAVDANINSVRFDPTGHLVQLKTSGKVIVQIPDAERKEISSQTRIGLMDDTLIKLPLVLSFENGIVTIDDGKDAFPFSIYDNRFLVLPDFDLSGFECSGECGNCPGCG
jgi:hypothetical protein